MMADLAPSYTACDVGLWGSPELVPPGRISTAWPCISHPEPLAAYQLGRQGVGPKPQSKQLS